MIMAEKATLYLENNKGMILDFTRSPQACDVYDFDGNLISGGGGGGNIKECSVVLTTSQTENSPRTYIYFENMARVTGNGISNASIKGIADGPPNPATVSNINAVILAQDGQVVTIYEENGANITVTLTGDISFVEEEPDGVMVSVNGDGTITVVAES